jgi:steroid 5-alpha reductase family enzyme
MATILTLLAINLGITVGVFFALWLLSLALRDASIVDPCWGIGFVLVAAYSFLVVLRFEPRSQLMVCLTTIWGLRLSAYLLWRNWGQGEDRRYRAMRENHGARFWIVSLGTVFMLQALLLWFVSWPVQMAILAGGRLNAFDFAGMLLWLIGMIFESVGDFQLASFVRMPKNAGRVLDTGLWRYTRHPNYFGDFCVWWGLYLIAAAGGAWWTVLSPLIMSVLLMKVSGVVLLESTIEERRPAYRAYIERTNAFFPWHQSE